MINFPIIALVPLWYGDYDKNEIIFEYFEYSCIFLHKEYFEKLISFLIKTISIYVIYFIYIHGLGRY